MIRVQVTENTDEKNREPLYFKMQRLKRALPHIIIKVRFLSTSIATYDRHPTAMGLS